MAKYSQQISGPDLTISMTAIPGHFKIGRLLCLENARTTPMAKPRTQPAAATIRLMSKPPHLAGGTPSLVISSNCDSRIPNPARNPYPPLRTQAGQAK